MKILRGQRNMSRPSPWLQRVRAYRRFQMLLERELQALSLEYMVRGRNIIQELPEAVLIPVGRMLSSVLISLILFAHVICNGALARWTELDNPENSGFYQTWLQVIAFDWRILAVFVNLTLIIPTAARDISQEINKDDLTIENTWKILRRTAVGLMAMEYVLWIVVFSVCTWSVRVMAALCVLHSDMLIHFLGYQVFKEAVKHPLTVMMAARWHQRLERY